MSSDSTNSQVLQDTFNELQAQLLQMKNERNDPSATNPATPKDRTVQDIVTELARKEGFEVTHVLGMGGMGAVVRATDMKLKRTVALKFLPPELISDVHNVIELRKEAELASRIQDENVVHVLSWHEVDNVPFFAMEFVEGETVDQVVRRRGRLPLPDALRIIAEASRGLEALHASDIIHRDIKPQNIMIANSGRVKIMDFGISRTKDMINEEAQASKIAGTPKYMSPEQARGEAATKCSDIYSLGATLYFMLTGRSPVENATDMREQLRMVRDGKLVPITNILPKLDRRVARIISRSMHLQQPRRPFNVQAFREEVEQAFIEKTAAERSLMGEVVRANWKFILPITALFIGFFIGLYVGKEMEAETKHSRLARSGPVLRLGETQLASLKEIGAVDEASPEVESLMSELGEALKKADASRVAGLVPAAERAIQKWEAVQLLRESLPNQEASERDRTSARISALEGADSAESQRLLSDWRAQWYRSLVAGKNNPSLRDEAAGGLIPQVPDEK